MPRCYLALGGNLGDTSVTFRQVFTRLNCADCTVHAVSRFYCTPAVGDRSGGAFLNAAVSIDTGWSAQALLDQLQTIETEFGRMRNVRWGPRTLDLDLLFYGDESFETPRLTVPHPACWYRRFVLDPLTEIAPDLIHPARRLSIRSLRERLLPRPLPVALAGGDLQDRLELIDHLSRAFPQAEIIDWLATSVDETRRSTVEPAFIFWLGRDSPESGNDARFAALPELPRLPVPATSGSAEEFVRYVLQSALDEPTVSD